MLFLLLDEYVPQALTDVILSYLNLHDYDHRYSSARLFHPYKDFLDLPVPKTVFTESVWYTRYWFPEDDSYGVQLYAAKLLQLDRSYLLRKIFNTDMQMDSHCHCNQGFLEGVSNNELDVQQIRFITEHWCSGWIPRMQKKLTLLTKLQLRRTGILPLCLEMVQLVLNTCPNIQTATMLWVKEWLEPIGASDLDLQDFPIL